MAVHNVSDLRHRISLERPLSPTYDAEGYLLPGTEGEWEPVKQVWALARDISGKEFFEAHATQALNMTVFETRALSGVAVDNSWSVVHKGVRYGVIHINHRDYRGQWWEIRAQRAAPEEGATDGDGILGRGRLGGTVAGNFI